MTAENNPVAYLPEGSCWLSCVRACHGARVSRRGVLADGAPLAGRLHTISMARAGGAGRAPVGLGQAGQGFSIPSIKKAIIIFLPLSRT